jgi:hypothetical protein
VGRVNGIFHNLPEHVYRSDPAISQSALKVIARSPAHYQAKVQADDEEDSRALILGRVVSVLVLEPDRESWWTVKPDDLSLTTTEGKQWAREQAKWDDEKDGKFPRSAKDALEKKGVAVISFDEFQCASAMAAAVKEHPTASLLLDGAKCEVSCFTELETEHGPVAVKCRHDIVPVGNCCADLKTTLDSRPTEFLKSVVKFGYGIQMASYMEIYNRLNPNDPKDVALIIAVEKKPPFAVKVHRFGKTILQDGHDQYVRLLNQYALCKKTGEWPGYSPNIETLEMPEWAKSRITL